MSDEYRRVLHEWAREQLETKSSHVGPFTIRDVGMYWADSYGTYEDSSAELHITFDHGDACTRFPRHGSEETR